MASDKASLLKQRLRRGSDSFSFNALIEGVSTLEEEARTEAAAVEPVTTAALSVELECAPIPQIELTEPEPQPALVLETAPVRAAAPDTEAVRLRWALDTLASRFTREVSRFAAALAEFDAPSAGFHLAQVNQALELLQPLDPTGDVARNLEIAGAPPSGRAWPAPAWSFVEFAESPLSGLLPGEADERYVREVLYSAWGPTSGQDAV